MKIPNSIYMVGIGGIGMSALAQYLAHTGHVVRGTDREESPIVEMLRKKRIEVAIGTTEIPNKTELLIYSDAVPTSNALRTQNKEKGIPEMSYFEALGEISRGVRTIAVAGTHGKTTTTGMLAAILKAGGYEPTAIVGSVVQDFGSNFLTGSPDLFVIEACEYRDHILKLDPEILVITNIELDHTDYFPNLEALQETFRTAAHKVQSHGAIVTSPGSPNIAEVLAGSPARIFDYYDLEVPELKLIGEFNKMNARAAKMAAKVAFPDIPDEVMDAALAEFKGSWRRFDFKGETPSGALVYDDYAHHPTAVEKTIEAAKDKFPGKRIVVAFHPHLYSRTKSFLKEFAAALSKPDLALIAPIYAAREEDDGTVSNKILADEVNALGGNAYALEFHEIRDRLLEEKEGTLIITMGAGDIYKVAEEIAD